MLLISASCDKGDDTGDVAKGYRCQAVPVMHNYSRNQLLQLFDAEVIQAIAASDMPDSNGAMGRNRNGYFHVRFQMGISAQADYAIVSEDTQALEYTIKAIEYAFDHQLPAGDFELTVPAELSDQTPGEADLASGVSFFLSSLGLALNTLEQSSWYHSAEILPYKNRVDALLPKIQNAADWLLSKKAVLEAADENAPNRVFFNALAYYGLGKWLNDDNLMLAGVSFAEQAISKQHANGYFVEGSGWDSSYQGVGIYAGFGLYSLLDASEPIRAPLWDCLSCAVDWQKSRVLESGEISTEGNSRVYPGGEDFLGQEKQVDALKTIIGFFVMGYYSGDSGYIQLAHKVIEYYT